MSDIFPQPFHSTLDGPVSVAFSPSTFTINSNVAVTSLPVMHLSDHCYCRRPCPNGGDPR